MENKISNQITLDKMLESPRV